MTTQDKPTQSLVSRLAPGASGLEQMRAMMAMGPTGGFGSTIGFQLVDVEEGMVVFESTPGEHLYNPIGTVHGGYAATLLDSACGCATHSKLAPGQGYTTLELKVAYHKAISKDVGRLRATGRVLSFGRRAAFAEAKLTDDAGKLYASATSTLLVMSA